MSIHIHRTLRIAVILLAQGILVYGHFFGHSGFTILAFVGLLAVFFVFSHGYLRLINKDKIAKTKLKLEQRNIDRRSGNWIKFESNGAEYVNANHPYSKDLDLFGEDSLFQYLNDTNTQYGKEILKLLFLTDKRDKAAVLRRQSAVKEISARQDFCETLKITGMLSENISHSPEEIVNFFESGNSLFGKLSLKLIVRAIPIVTALFVLLNIIIGLNNALLIFTGIAVIMQVMVFVSFSTKTEAVLKELSKFGGSLDDFGTITELIKEITFSAELNQTWQSKLPTKWTLKRMTWALSVRNITLLDLVLNILFLWDIQCVCALETMRRKGAKDMRTWLEAIGYFEAMASVAILPQLNPNWAYPEFGDELTIMAENLGHPLIEEHDRVTNDFSLEGIAIISGSNMSGKTTFLRAVGINLVMGYIGAPVCATRFYAPSVDIWTCMRPPDNLKQNISTFYAELLRIKNIIDFERPMLFLIDEIFAGTNSEDRVEGAKQVLLCLSKRQNLGLVTTHDLEVCKTEGFDNFHFSEHYVDDEIVFDFKIMNGISTTRNARFLMKMIGIDVNHPLS